MPRRLHHSKPRTQRRLRRQLRRPTGKQFHPLRPAERPSSSRPFTGGGNSGSWRLPTHRGRDAAPGWGSRCGCRGARGGTAQRFRKIPIPGVTFVETNYHHHGS